MSDSETVTNLKQVLRKYFSPENLRHDAVLTQLLARQQFVTVEEILRLSLVKKTLDASDISDADKQQMVLVAIRGMSDMLTLYDDDRYVIPKVPQNRTTIILRDLPENVKLEEIKSLLDNDNCKNVQEIRPDVNKTWFVTFDNEEDCVTAATWIQLSAKLRGEKVRCRIKSEHNPQAYGNPYAPTTPSYYPPPVAQMNPQDDPEFVEWLENKPRSKRSSKKKATQNPDKDVVDYDGIFKLISRDTFEMVVSRYQENNHDGPKKIPGHGKHRTIVNDRPTNGFMTLQDIDI